LVPAGQEKDARAGEFGGASGPRFDGWVNHRCVRLGETSAAASLLQHTLKRIDGSKVLGKMQAKPTFFDAV